MKTIHNSKLQNQLYLSGYVYHGEDNTKYISQLNTDKITASENSPAILYREDYNILTIEGNISSDYAVDIMSKTIDMVDTHLRSHKELSLSVSINKLNTSGVKTLMNLLNRLKNYIAKGKEVEVAWVLSESDEDMIDLVLDMINLYGININMRLI